MEPECAASDLHVNGEQENMNDMMTWKDRRLRGRERVGCVGVGQDGYGGQFFWSWLIYHMTTAAIWAAEGQTAAHWAAAGGSYKHNTWSELHKKAAGR